MAKKDEYISKKPVEEMLEGSNVVEIELEHEMKKSFIAYAMAVNVSRAIPDVRDGLKPVHRRIIYDMYEQGLTSDKPFRKCAAVVGDVLGKYHPHGDSSVYDALVRLAQDFSIRCPLVDGHGNFGSVDGDPAAAYRYTEARMSKIADEMVRDIEKKTVDFYPNFDDTREQPSVLPSRYPNLLVNGSDGIAVGMATSIPPHNLGEVIDATIAVLNNPEITVEELVDNKYIPAPDFPTGATILSSSEIRDAYLTGNGKCVIRAKAEIEEHANKYEIVITELPYQVNKAQLASSIAALSKDKIIEGILDVQDHSDRDGMRLIVEVRSDANAQVVLNQLYKRTQLQVSFSMNMLALIDGSPKVLNLKEILGAYCEHQKDVVQRRTKFDLEKAQEREHIVFGLVKALKNIDAVIATIKASKDRQDAINNLMERFELSEKQSIAIIEMRLQRLTALEIEKLEEELAQLDAFINDMKDILAKPERVVEIIKTELNEIKDKYNTPRRSILSYDYTNIDDESLIPQEDIVITATNAGYIKRLPISEYKAQNRGGRGVTGHKTKEDDFVATVLSMNTHQEIMFFSNFGKVYRIKGYSIPEALKNSKGKNIVNLLSLDANEKISASIVCPTREKDVPTPGYLLMATKDGLIKKTAMSEFDRIQSNGKIAISLTRSEDNLTGDELVSVQLTSGEDEIIMASSGGKCIRFREKDVRPTGRTSQGVKSISLDENERVVDMTVVKEGYEVLTITENGYGKRTDLSEYNTQNRGGKGVKVGVLNEKTGNVVNLKLVHPTDEDVMIVSDKGIIVRIKADLISKIGRNTQGVIIMKTNDAKVVSFTVVPHEDEEFEDESNVVEDEQHDAPNEE